MELKKRDKKPPKTHVCEKGACDTNQCIMLKGNLKGNKRESAKNSDTFSVAVSSYYCCLLFRCFWNVVALSQFYNLQLQVVQEVLRLLFVR